MLRPKTTLTRKLTKLTTNDWALLHALHSAYMKGQPYLTQAELSTLSNKDKATVSRAVKVLERLNLVYVRREGRHSFISLSGLGFEIFREPVEGIVRKSLQQILKEGEDVADECVGKRLKLPPLNEVRKKLEETFGLPSLEEIIEKI